MSPEVPLTHVWRADRDNPVHEVVVVCDRDGRGWHERYGQTVLGVFTYCLVDRSRRDDNTLEWVPRPYISRKAAAQTASEVLVRGGRTLRSEDATTMFRARFRLTVEQLESLHPNVSKLVPAGTVTFAVVGNHDNFSIYNATDSFVARAWRSSATVEIAGSEHKWATADWSGYLNLVDSDEDPDVPEFLDKVLFEYLFRCKCGRRIRPLESTATYAVLNTLREHNVGQIPVSVLERQVRARGKWYDHE